MATLSDSLVSSASRKQRIRMRPDLSAKRQRYLGQTYWVVKEPIGLNYFRFQEEEWAILQMIDGESSLEDIKDRFEAEFPPQKITLDELQQFLGMLHRSGLIIADVPGQGHELRKRRDERRRKEILGAMSNILCIRFKGFDPERLLNWLYPKVKWLFHPITFLLSIILMASALGLILVEFDVFRSKLPGFYQFFNPTNALLLAATLGIAKVFHEFGHGLLCKHFGGECHEIGVMILVLTPCLYCNVSDSWMLPSKWQRAAIGAGGMYVEAVIGAMCAFIWWFSEPGLLNNMCLNLMFIASISTLLFNGNPLLRYDGYYILADILEIPNLRQKATSILGHKMGKWFLGIDPPEDPFLPKRNQVLFALYSVAAVMYRWFVLISILYFLMKVFEPYGLQVFGYAIVAMSVYGILVMPFWKLYKYLAVPGRLYKVKKVRVYATLAAIAVLIGLIGFVPLPHSVLAPLELKPLDAKYVSVDRPGRLAEIAVERGQKVAEGDLLARLVNENLTIDIEKRASELARAKIRLESLTHQSLEDSTTNYSKEISQAEKDVAIFEEQLDKKRKELERLTLTAPISGTVMSGPWVESRKDPTGRLPRWSGSLLDQRNRNAMLEPSTIFCLVGDPASLKANIVIDQSDIDFVSPNQSVEMKFDRLPHDIFTGTISDVSPSEMEAAPQRMAAKAQGDLPTETDEAGIERPQSPSYEALVELRDEEGVLAIGILGQAKIHVAKRTLWSRISRFAMETFNFKL